jgi:hypothetical protein
MSVLRLDWRPLSIACAYLPAPGSAFMAARGNNRRSRGIEHVARLGLWESEGGALAMGPARRYESQSLPKVSL